ncbi:hypothetical protein NQ315_004547 [Exocentrus adspersus]|uniref:CCHC-type domain-containing protein n=1 Tax=Exocentrus adspersus TaxID=1586481 RepID=A0AAV8V819_9CUCU|nr:hypothetical protein NQ315_004547 [Exocentrus adspersus]
MTTPGGAKTPTDPKPDPAAVDLGDLRLSWIYKLRKDEIDAELDKFRLDLTGTVEEKKKRLVRFIREGCTSPRPGRQTEHLQFPVPPPLPTTGNQIPSVQQPSLTAPPATTVPPFPGAVSTFTVSTVCERVRKWNLRFNGKTDAVEFLEKLCEFQEHSGISTTALLPTLYEIFQGNALAWYRNNRELWSCWEDFVTDFKQFYLPVDYESFLEEQIYHRRQQPGESGRDYLVAIQTLLRRHGGFTPEKALYRLHGNLRPEYKEYIRLSDVQGARDLVRRIEEFETIQEEKSRSKARQPNAIPSYGNRPKVIAPPPAAGATPGQNPEPTTAPPRPTAMPGNHRSPHPTTPSRTASSPNTRSAAGNTATTGSGFDRNSICWRCGKGGHFRSQCQAPPRLFCSRYKASESVTAPPDDNRPHVPVRIYDQTFLALIDTGAARSYIGNRVHQHCDQQKVPNKTATARIIQLANGDVTTVDRAYQLEFSVGNTRFKEWLDYLPDLLGDVVFGMDLLSQHDFTISPATATVWLGNTVVSTECSWYRRKKSEVEQNPEAFPDFCIRNDQLYRHFWDSSDLTEPDLSDPWKLCVPTPLRRTVLQENHDAPSAGHMGIAKTIARIAQRYYWPALQTVTAADSGENAAIPKPTSLGDHPEGSPEDNEIPTAHTDRLQKLKEVYELVRVNLAQAFTSQSHYYNLRRREWRCRVGDRVMKRENPLSSAAKGFAAKLAPKYSGPYTVTAVVSPVVYDLRSDTGRKLSHIHIKDLKPFVPYSAEVPSTPAAPPPARRAPERRTRTAGPANPDRCRPKAEMGPDTCRPSPNSGPVPDAGRSAKGHPPQPSSDDTTAGPSQTRGSGTIRAFEPQAPTTARLELPVAEDRPAIPPLPTPAAAPAPEVTATRDQPSIELAERVFRHPHCGEWGEDLYREIQALRPPHYRPDRPWRCRFVDAAQRVRWAMDLTSLHLSFSSDDEDPVVRALEEALREPDDDIPPEPRAVSPIVPATGDSAVSDHKRVAPDLTRIILSLQDEPDLGIRLLGPPPTAAPAAGSTAPSTDCHIYLPVDRWALCWRTVPAIRHPDRTTPDSASLRTLDTVPASAALPAARPSDEAAQPPRAATEAIPRPTCHEAPSAT